MISVDEEHTRIGVDKMPLCRIVHSTILNVCNFTGAFILLGQLQMYFLHFRRQFFSFVTLKSVIISLLM